MSEEEIGSIVDFGEDLSDAEPPVPLPVGKYPATIREAKVRLSQKDNRYAEVAFHISPDAFPPDFPAEENPEGIVLYYRRVTLEPSQKSRWYCRKFCEAIGAPMSSTIDVNEWVGLTASVEVIHEPYEGIPRATITRVSAEG